jgi:inosine-uridine nucleoside N-ribohydrolase
MGSPAGDVDDAFAIAALARSGLPIAGLAACAGNTAEELAHRNNERLAPLVGYAGPLLRARDAAAALRSFGGRVAALGPLTNVAGAAAAAEVVLVGGTLRTRGRWPPLLPHEFNLTCDPGAARALFASTLPLTIVPLDVARGLWVRERDLEDIPGAFGELARRESRRWFRRLLWARQTRRFAIYDLVAALYLIGDDGLTMEETTAVMRPNTFLEFGRGSRPVKVCTALRREVLWERFLRLCR